jgi:ferric-dicitrate binding protein FerR (iron transport regulator)
MEGTEPTLRVPEVAMTNVSPPTALDAGAGSPLSDERALERLFRSHFQPLSEEAKTHLGEEASSTAPRVVESAFRTAWEERERFTTEQELDAFLHDAVRRCAARELSRRAAAHHFGAQGKAAARHSGPVADVDQSWTHLQHALHPEERSEAVLAHAEHLRHDAAHHVADLTKKRSWKMPLLIGLIGVLIVGGLAWWLDRLGQEGVVTNALSKADVRKHETGPGQFAVVTLHDTTKVTLAPASRLIVPKQFGEEIRAVKLEGAGTFEVTPGHTQPLQIRAGNAAVYVTGTTLVVRAYPTDHAVTVLVREGQAALKVGSEEPQPLLPGKPLRVEKDGQVKEPTAEQLAEAMSWAETPRRLTITDRQLREAVPEINRWYAVDIKVPQVQLLDRKASVDASLDSLRVVIAQVASSADVEFGYESNTMVFRTKKAEAPKGKKK